MPKNFFLQYAFIAKHHYVFKAWSLVKLADPHEDEGEGVGGREKGRRASSSSLALEKQLANWHFFCTRGEGGGREKASERGRRDVRDRWTVKKKRRRERVIIHLDKVIVGAVHGRQARALQERQRRGRGTCFASLSITAGRSSARFRQADRSDCACLSELDRKKDKKECRKLL